jgi:succinate-semialdehyde dehydrogenase/glutarate-semialdehyde dehydrogenase
MRTIKSVNPATNELLKEFDTITPDALQSVIAKADKAFNAWKETSFAERAAILNKAADLMMSRQRYYAELVTLEMGKKIMESLAEVEFSSEYFRYYANHAEALLADKKINTPLGDSWLSYEPIGVLLSVQPWNFPYYQVLRVAAPQLMAGNAMILKHASNVPQCAEAISGILSEAGLPDGVFTNIFLPGSEVQLLLDDPRIRGVMLTGSEKAGASIAAAAGRNIKKATLELGGSDPLIILDDADLDAAFSASIYGRMYNAGQACVSPKRIIIQESIAEKFLEKATAIFDTLKTGDPMDPETDIPPLSSESAVEEILSQIERAVHEGARLIRGGYRSDRKGSYMEPAILTDITPDMTAFKEEIFGPVLMLYKVKDDQEAINLANATDFGLGGAVFGSEARSVAIARKIESGMVYVNTLTAASPERPFGGTKNSGFGREQSEAGIMEFVNVKNIVVANGARRGH